MEEKELLTVICDISTKLGHIDGVLVAHYKALDNLITSKADNAEMIKEIKDQICDMQEVISALDRKLTASLLQLDFAEVRAVKEARQAARMKVILKSKKFSWKDLFDVLKAFFTNSKFLAFLGLLIFVGVLLLTKVIDIKTVIDWVGCALKALGE